MMATNAGVIKAIVSFYSVNSVMEFEKHRSRIPTNDLNTVRALKKHFIQSLGLKELTIIYGLEDFDIKLYPQAAQALSTNHTRNTIWHRIVRVCMRFSTRYPWRWLKVKILNKNGLPYSIRALFAPGVVILPILLDLSD